MLPSDHIHLELKNVSKAVLRRIYSTKVRAQILSSIDMKVQKGELGLRMMGRAFLR